MGVYTGDNKFIETTRHKTFHFDLPKDADNNMKHKTNFIIKHNELLADHTIKIEIRQLLSKYKYGNDIHKHGKQ